MLLALTLVALAQAQTPALRTRVEQALQTAPIEAFDTVIGKTVVRSAMMIDLDQQGDSEVVAVLAPAYRQTPTLIFFRQDSAGGLQRIAEGLAPGALIPLSRTQGDSHVLRVGVDMVAANGAPIDTVKFVQIANANKMSLVVYRTFMHADMRTGATFFIQQSGTELPAGNDGTCLDFEFSPIVDAAYGTLAGGGEARYLVVLTKGLLTFYSFNGVSATGWLSKTTWTRPVDPSTTGFARLRNGNIALAGGREGIEAP